MATATASTVPPSPAKGTEESSEIDALAHLEERIQRAVALVTRLRQEKDAALAEFATTRAALDESETRNAQLTEELESLRAERTQVRKRLEKLVSHIDQLGAA